MYDVIPLMFGWKKYVNMEKTTELRIMLIVAFVAFLLNNTPLVWQEPLERRNDHFLNINCWKYVREICYIKKEKTLKHYSFCLWEKCILKIVGNWRFSK